MKSPTRLYENYWNNISPLFSKMNAEDFKMFVYHITLNPKLINRIDIITRLSLLKYAISYCNERMKQDRMLVCSLIYYFLNCIIILITVNFSEGWSFTHSELMDWENLLQTLRSELWQNLSLHGQDIQHILKFVSYYFFLVKKGLIKLSEIN